MELLEAAMGSVIQAKIGNHDGFVNIDECGNDMVTVKMIFCARR